MTNVVAITGESREKIGTGATREQRRSGRLPAVVYGGKNAPVSISLDPRDIEKGLNRAGFYTTLLDITVGNDVHHVLPKAVQFHPVSDKPIHVDFLRVDENSVIRAVIPVHFVNQDKCPGIKMGGTLNIVRHNVEVICPAHGIPESFTIDLAKYKIGTAVRSSCIELAEKVKFVIDDRDFTIATIAAPRGVSVTEDAAAAESA